MFCMLSRVKRPEKTNHRDKIYHQIYVKMSTTVIRITTCLIENDKKTYDMTLQILRSSIAAVFFELNLLYKEFQKNKKCCLFIQENCVNYG